ncbi:efflux RND transporter periplasmic adaptor subunit [Halodurantibacterium flavum]|uniref:Efflux RND transporter periplasmic adaptor subunit n=1 Tax=Halodurantibacterium flavum TaxID=1382802 RepID=A0ABW4S4W4_9RHOB
MPIWKQMTLALSLVLLAVVAWALFVPSAAPLLQRVGILQPLQQIGLAATPPADPRPRGGPGQAGGTATRVVAAPVTIGILNDDVSAIGTGQAIRSVALVPEVAGRVTEVLVTSGEAVTAGQTLVRLDSEAEEIAVQRATLALEDAQATAERLERLRTSGAASEVQRQDAALAVRNAELALRQAAFDLARRRIVAPITGSVGMINIEPGSQITSSTEITRIDDRTSLLIDFRLPERLVAQVRVGTPVTAIPLARPGQEIEGRISAIDNRVDQSSRTLRIQARIENTDDDLRAGMAFSISLRLEGEPFPAVDPLSIQWGAEGSFVWAVQDGRATRVPVRIMQRASNRVLVRAALAEGDLVIREGVTNLRPGTAVQPEGAELGEQQGEAAEVRASGPVTEG